MQTSEGPPATMDLTNGGLSLVNMTTFNELQVEGIDSEPASWLATMLLVIKSFIMGLIIVAAIFGNILVIISVVRFRKLRIITNYFLVSLAVADILVALLAMSFNASVIIFGRWMFGYRMCDVWNSFDVYFSTASILHLCCISVDRYFAISQPLMYPMKITAKKVAVMLTNVWIWPAAISFVPIFLGWYTTEEHLRFREANPHRCEFVVNKVYAIISSSVSFWIPCAIMLFTYNQIYRMASRQEKMLMKNADAALLFRQQNQRRSAEMEQHQIHHQMQMQVRPEDSETQDASSTPAICVTSPVRNAPPDVLPESGYQANGVVPGKVCTVQVTLTEVTCTSGSRLDGEPSSQSPNKRPSAGDRSALLINATIDAESHSTPTKDKHLQKLKREHKAARTLGIIMGAFIACWLPFFIWYLSISLCGDACYCPDIVVDVLFWIGYFNSTLNPLIYAYFHKDFREAFKKTLLCFFCRCWKRQPSDAYYAHIVRTSLAQNAENHHRIRHSSADTITGIERIDSKRPSTCVAHKL